MALVTQSNSGAAFSSLLAPFTSVATATVRPMKGISAAELATLREGDKVYTTSIRDYWKWVPTSTATDDSTGAAAQLRYCNPTVNGANPGRFERLFICSPDWLLQDFFIDNTGIGHNENSGATALLPLNNDSELYQRWSGGGKRAFISTIRSVTYKQSPTVQTNYLFEILKGGGLTILGTPTVTKTGILITVVTAQVRTAGAEVALAITSPTLGAADVGNLVFITASTAPANVGAYTRILKDNGGGSVRISPFGTFTVAAPQFTQVTPLVGDTIEVRSMSTVLSIGSLEGFGSFNDAIANGPLQAVVFDSITLDSTTGTLTATTFIGKLTAAKLCYIYARSILQSISLGGLEMVTTVVNHIVAGGGISGGGIVIRGASVATLNKPGCTGGVQVRGSGYVTVLTDTYFQNTFLTNNLGGTVVTQGAAFFDRTLADNAISILGGVNQQTGAVPDWGTANAGHGITVATGSFYGYQTKPTINGTLGPGREARVGGTDKLYTAVPYIEGANNASLVIQTP